MPTGEIDRGVDRLELDVGVSLLDLVDFLLHRGGDDDVALALGAPDPERDDGLAVEPGEGPRRGDGIGHDAEILEPDLAAHRQADHQSGKLVEGLGPGQRPDRLVAAADLGEAAGDVDIGTTQPLADVGRGQAHRLEPVGVERHQDFAVDAADALHLGDAAHALKRPLHHVVHEPRQPFRRLARRDRGIGDDGKVDEVDTLDQRLAVDVSRQIGPRPGHRVLDVVERAIGVRLQPELDRRDRQPVGDLRSDVADAFDAGHAVFDVFGDLDLELRRSRAELGHDH